MKHVNTPPTGEENRDRFLLAYTMAWEASGKPDRSRIYEVFAAVFGDACPSADVHALWVFMKTEVERGTPLNWFGQTVYLLGTITRQEREALVNAEKCKLKAKLDTLFPDIFSEMFPDRER